MQYTLTGMISTRARFEGCMLGLAVGDALGFPTEFRRREAIVAAFPPEGVTDFVGIQDPRWPKRPYIVGPAFPPGTWSDDTQMTLAVARGLLREPDAPLDVLMAHLAAEFVAWSQSPDNNRAPGSTCMTGCQALAAGTPWHRAGVAESKGCGANMRVAPVGLLYQHDHARLLEVAAAQSRLTHGHPTAVAASQATALAVALACQGESPEAIHAALLAQFARGDAALLAVLQRVPEVLHLPPAQVLCEGCLGEGWIAEEALAGALYCFWRGGTDFGATVLAAANTDGDSDSLACIAGALSGAANGVDAIVLRWRENVEGAGMVLELARSLCSARVDKSVPV